MDKQQFFNGAVFDAWRWFGAHLGGGGAIFRTFAPNASRITLTGAMNGWTETDLHQDGRSGFWEVSVPGTQAGQLYKYRIYAADGSVTEHCDPYGFAMEMRPACCSIVTDLEEYRFTDDAWMQARSADPDAPLNIYEMHLGSWQRNPEDANGWFTYEQLADRLIPYLLDGGYTHVEFLPLSEHPFDGSWGYQNTGFFAPTSRYGTPAQLRLLIDRLHHAGIGAIMDFVPVHFAVDSYGLARYDGTPLYEYPHSAVGESEWGSYNFIHSRREVRCFLQSAANYWLEEFHFDGLRMDAVSRLIYWQGDEQRGINGDTLDFLKGMNCGLKARHPSALLIAEDSTSYPGVTRPVDEGGLGFDYKWDLGWMHDTLEFCQTQPDLRPRDRGKLLWSMHYFANERYLLPLSHDEVVHGKASIVQKMWGADEKDKYAQARTMYLYMFAHPGKKLNFMGNELGQLYEWNEAGTLDGALAERPFHLFFHSLCKTYRDNPALHCDYAPDSFSWADSCADAPSLIGMVRRGHGETLLALCNFGSDPAVYDGPLGDAPSLLLHTDLVEFGGVVAHRGQQLGGEGIRCGRFGFGGHQRGLRLKGGGKCRQKRRLAGFAAGLLFFHTWFLSFLFSTNSLLNAQAWAAGSARPTTSTSTRATVMPVMFWMVCLTFSCTFSQRGMILLPYTAVRCTVTVAMPSSSTTLTGFCKPVRPSRPRTFWLPPVVTSATPSISRAASLAIFARTSVDICKLPPMVFCTSMLCTLPLHAVCKTAVAAYNCRHFR